MAAKQIDFLLDGYRHPTTGAVLSGGKVKTFLDGTTTLSALWTDRDKAGTADNPVVLDSAGAAEVYGDNVYKFEIYDSDDVLLDTLDGLDYKGFPVTTLSLTTTGAADAIVLTSKENSLASYVNGAMYSFQASADNTGAVTVNIDTVGAKDLKDADGSALEAGQLKTDAYYWITWVDANDEFELATNNGNNLTLSGTVQAEHLYSTDDAVIDNDLSVGGNITENATFSGNIIYGPFRNYINRGVFTRVNLTQITIGPASYHHKGTNSGEQIVYWDTELTYNFSLGLSEWVYLYIDDSDITAGTPLLTATELTDNNTAPTYTQTGGKVGWYNGQDRCLFAVYADGSGNMIKFHDGGTGLIFYDDDQIDRAAADLDTAWTDVSLTVPPFAQTAICTFNNIPGATPQDLVTKWRPNGSDADGVRCGVENSTMTTGEIESIDTVLVRPVSGIIEIKNTADGDGTVSVRTDGWGFPVGM